MEWIVKNQERGGFKLVSKNPDKGENFGLLPRGSYLTTELDSGAKVVFRVESSGQNEQYSPSEMIINMNLDPLTADQKSLNVITAIPVWYSSQRQDGLIDPIPALTKCRRSTNEEINEALGSPEKGVPIFLATLQSSQSQILVDNEFKPVHVKIPNEAFYHQMVVCGKTGSGKTVALKYLAQYFAEEFGGSVLAINVKEEDLLRMNEPSTVINENIKKEWEILKRNAEGVTNTVVYYPGTRNTKPGISAHTIPIKLDVKSIDPEALSGLLRNLTELAAEHLPDIFRYWREVYPNKPEDYQFNDFVQYFNTAQEDQRTFTTLNTIGQENTYSLHAGIYNGIQRNIIKATEYFDAADSIAIDENDLLEEGKLSIVDVVGHNDFGSVLLRDILYKIDKAKSEDKDKRKRPVLIIIDEVHLFYESGSSKETLGALDTICRTGRSRKMGVIFASQNPSDIPTGLKSVVNTHIYLKTNSDAVKGLGFNRTETEMLSKGYAVANIHELSQARVIKLPLAYAGVHNE